MDLPYMEGMYMESSVCVCVCVFIPCEGVHLMWSTGRTHTYIYHPLRIGNTYEYTILYVGHTHNYDVVVCICICPT